MSGLSKACPSLRSIMLQPGCLLQKVFADAVSPRSVNQAQSRLDARVLAAALTGSTALPFFSALRPLRVSPARFAAAFQTAQTGMAPLTDNRRRSCKLFNPYRQQHCLSLNAPASM